MRYLTYGLIDESTDSPNVGWQSCAVLLFFIELCYISCKLCKLFCFTVLAAAILNLHYNALPLGSSNTIVYYINHKCLIAVYDLSTVHQFHFVSMGRAVQKYPKSRFNSIS